jgi:hypothetical protein
LRISLGLPAESCARHGALSYCIILVDPISADPNAAQQFMGGAIIDRLAAGKGDDAVVLQTRLVIWVQGS